MTAGGPFIIEVYADWADYPHWVELDLADYVKDDPEADGSPRFESVTAAREWLNAFLDEQDEKQAAWWYEREAKVATALAVRAKRLKVLEDAGLLHDELDWHGGPLQTAPQSYKKPKGADRKIYRVAIDDGRVCGTCGVRSET